MGSWPDADGRPRLTFPSSSLPPERPTGLSRLTVPDIKLLLGVCGLSKKGDRGMLLATLTDFFNAHALSLEGSMDEILLELEAFADVLAMQPPKSGPSGEVAKKEEEMNEEEDEKVSCHGHDLLVDGLTRR